MSSANKRNEHMRKDSGNRFLVNLTFYVELAATAALGGIWVATKFPWLTLEVTAALLVLVVVSFLGVFWLLPEDE